MVMSSKRNGLRMKKIALVMTFMLTTVLTAVAAKKEYIVQYALRLADVTCDRDCGYVEGITAEPFTDLNGLECVSYRYKDDVVNMTWYLSDIALSFSLVNKLDTTLTMHWSQLSGRGVDGRPTRFGYTLERPRVLVALDVPAHTGLNGFLIPYVNYPVFPMDTIKPLVPGSFLSRKDAKKTARKYIGKEFKMYFPLTYGEKVYGYRLTFVVDEALAYIYREPGMENLVTAWNEVEEEEKKSILAFSSRKNRKKDSDGRKEKSVQRRAKVENPSLLAAAQPTAAPRIRPLVTDSTVTTPLSTYKRFLAEQKLPLDAADPLSRLIAYAAHIDLFHDKCPQEKVYLHLDNTAYFQGETIWYAATLTGGKMNAKAPSKVLYVELLSPTGVVLQQQKLKVTDGRCHGSFSLIDNAVAAAVDLRGAVGYPSGYYQIRAYTRAMLNFDEAGIYSRVIPVYKAPEHEGDYADPVMRQYKGKEPNRPEPKKSEKGKQLNISFYPEGGHLIKGVTCRVAFKAADQHGHGVEIKELKYGDDKRLPITAMHDGMGSFTLRVDEKSARQSVSVRWKGKNYTYRLPEVEDEGCSVRLKSEANGWLQATVSARKLGADSLLAYTITHEGEVCAFDTLHLATPSAADPVIYEQLRIPSRRLPTGVCQFTLYGSTGNVYAQRLFFADNGIPTVPVEVTTANDDIHPFDSVALYLQTASNTPATFSLAIRDAADYGTAYRDDIRTYMLLSSELKGLIENPGWYFSSPGKDATEDMQFRREALDYLMMVQGWTRHNWRQMAGLEPFKVQHYTEEQLVVDGWAFSRILEKPLANTRVGIRLSEPDGELHQEAIVTTDSMGYWSVGVGDFEGEWNLYLETRQPGDVGEKRTTRIRLERSSAPAVLAYEPLDTYLPHYAWDSDKLLTVVDAKDSEYALPTDAHLLNEVEVIGHRRYIDYCTFRAFDAEKDAELLIDGGNYTYKVVDYLRAKGYDVELPGGDLVTENVGCGRENYYDVLVTMAPIKNHRTLWYVRDGRWNKTSPASTPGYDLDLEDVKSVIVYDSPNNYETHPAVRELFTPAQIVDFSKAKNGCPAGLYIVEIELNPASRRHNYTDKNSRATTFAGYSKPVEFYAPTYPDGPVQGDKDYRRTIYWNPEVMTDSTGRATVGFYNNGYSQCIVISAEGLTNEGVPVLK